MGKKTSTGAAVNGGIPSASASAYGFSAKADASIVATAGIASYSVKVGQIAINGYSETITGFSLGITIVGNSNIIVKQDLTLAQQKTTAAEDRLKGIEASIAGMDTDIFALRAKTAGLESGVRALSVDM